ncbi:Ig-like domain-containing protein [Sandaracinus amylolyticus]|uniref:Ig-like domain-containing protein n=1 Tax=Sandaracinus amylolyticus TaxID=927083 RepID=UPI001F3764CD|nr:Ig-like domain-containing protein [Sandaracinus amylolyticus]
MGWCAAILVIAAPGCGDDDTSTGDDDASVPGDTVAPSVVSVTPSHGATGVAPDATLRVTFSEPMDPAAGTLEVRSGETMLTLGARSWNEDGTELSIRTAMPMPSGATRFAVEADFEDLAGNTLEEGGEVQFEVLDLVAPQIVSTTPAEGATVSVATAEIVFVLSESVRGDLPTLTITGAGSPVLGTPAWSDAHTLRVPVSGLAHEGEYRVTIAGVRDIAGNALDTSALGDEGALDFTADDDVAPVVTDSNPSDAQVDVAWDVLTQVVVLFSEPMDATAGTATLTVSGAATTLTGSWDMGGRRLLLDVTDRLENITVHRVALDGYRDVAGNALDGTVLLTDGAIDFTTGDLYKPYVVSSTPAEGATDVAPSTTAAPLEITITFSEAMDTSRTEVTIVGDGASITAAGTWSVAGTSLTIPVGARLNAGASYSIDLTAFRDATGTLFDAAHEGLGGDGELDFALRAPTGERCGDALTNEQAVEIDGAREWQIAAGGVTTDDGAVTCIPVAATLPDGVIRYRKTTPSLSAGGTALHITLRNGFNFEVTRDTCELPAADPSDQLRCSYMNADNTGLVETWLDVGPGDYYVWVSNFETFNQTTVRIAEEAMPRDGESCIAPYDGATDAAIYTAPTSPDGDHVWTITTGTIHGMERTVTPTGPGPLSCDPTVPLGHDAVIAFDKTSDASLVTVSVVPFGRASPFGAPAPHVDVEISRGGCDPTTAGRDVEVCATRLTGPGGGASFTIDGPAGRLDTWITAPQQPAPPNGLITAFVPFPGATVRISEFTPGLGDTCANAIPLSPGANTVAPDRTHRAYAPACMPTGALTWYRYTPTRNFAIIRTDTATRGAVVSAASAGTINCGDNLANGVGAATTVGQDVCIAVASGTGATSLSIQELDFGGVRGVPTNLGITFPATAPESIGFSGPRWITTTPTHIAVGLNQRVIATAPLAGGADFTLSTLAGTTRQFGLGAHFDGTSIIATMSGSSATDPRVARVADGMGAASTTDPASFVDMPPASTGYAAKAINAIARDGDNVIVATARAFSSPPSTQFYSIPIAGGAATLLGENTTFDGVAGLAVDATYFYMTTMVGSTRGLFRLPRAALANPSTPPELLAAVTVDFSNQPVYLDPANDALYFRATAITITSSSSEVWLVIDPDGVTPTFAGPIWRTTIGAGLGFDPSGPSLFVIDASAGTQSAARWLRLD